MNHMNVEQRQVMHPGMITLGENTYSSPGLYHLVDGVVEVAQIDENTIRIWQGSEFITDAFRVKISPKHYIVASAAVIHEGIPYVHHELADFNGEMVIGCKTQTGELSLLTMDHSPICNAVRITKSNLSVPPFLEESELSPNEQAKLDAAIDLFKEKIGARNLNQHEKPEIDGRRYTRELSERIYDEVMTLFEPFIVADKKVIICMLDCIINTTLLTALEDVKKGRVVPLEGLGELHYKKGVNVMTFNPAEQLVQMMAENESSLKEAKGTD